MKIQNGMITVHNIQPKGEECPFWIVTIIDGEAWYYGGYPSKKSAEQILKNLIQAYPQPARIVVANPEMQDA